MGDLSLAKQMTLAAKDSGADYVKFQTWSVSNLKPGPWDDDGRLDIYKKAELTKEMHYELKEYASENNIGFFSSVFNIQDVDFLSRLQPEIIKIPSHEIHNIELLTECAEKFETILVSTGASYWHEIERIPSLISDKRLVLMHCVSSYPCDYGRVNMKRLEDLSKLSNSRLGYSGHHPDISDAMLAISVGCEYIEKHFTIDNDLPGRDNKFAILPEKLKVLSDYRDAVEEMNLYHGKDFQDIEKDTVENYRGRWSK
jgi:sialic acid synthase SpsE